MKPLRLTWPCGASAALTPWQVRFRLWDVVQGQDLGGRGYTVPQSDLRLASHKVADYIYEKLTGEKGVFSTRLAYVTKAGSRYTLWVADSDGENAQAALSSPEPIISPSWSPDGRQLAYVSFESRKPVIYVHDVAWRTSVAPTARPPGRPTDAAWPSRSRAMAARSFISSAPAAANRAAWPKPAPLTPNPCSRRMAAPSIS